MSEIMDLDGVNGGIGYITKEGTKESPIYRYVDQKTGNTVDKTFASLQDVMKASIEYHKKNYSMLPKEARKKWNCSSANCNIF